MNNLIEFKNARVPAAGTYADRLTPRERQVVELAHLRNRDIAEQLGISAATVKTHIERILMKTGAENRTQVAVLVERETRRAA